MRRDSGYSPAWCEQRQSTVRGVLFLFRKKQMSPNVGPGTKPGVEWGVPGAKPWDGSQSAPGTAPAVLAWCSGAF